MFGHGRETLIHSLLEIGPLPAPQIRRTRGEQSLGPSDFAEPQAGFDGDDVGHVPLPRRFVALADGLATLRSLSQPEHRRHCNTRQQHDECCRNAAYEHTVPPHELRRAIGRRRRTCQHRLARQVPLDVRRQLRRRAVAPRPVLLQRLHRDPVEITRELTSQGRSVRLPELRRLRRTLTLQRAQPRTRFRRLVLADLATDLVEPGSSQLPRLEGQRTHQQLVEHHAERVHVGPRVHVLSGHLRLFRTHVLGRADQHAHLGEQGLLGQPVLDRLGHTEVDDLGRRLAVLIRHQHVGRLQVAVDDRLLVGVLNAVADLLEQLQTLLRGQAVAVAVLGDRHALHVLHGEVGPAALGRPGVEHLGHARMVHHRQRLPLGLEAGHDLLGVHAVLDDLERDLASHRLGLLGEVDHAHAAFAETLQDAIGANSLGHGGRSWWSQLGRIQILAILALVRPGLAEQARRSLVVCQQGLDFRAKFGIAGARLIEKGLPLTGIELTGLQEQSPDLVVITSAHDPLRPRWS